MWFSPTCSAHYVGLCQSKSRLTTIAYVMKIYNLSEYEFASWDSGGDNLALWRGHGGEKDDGGGYGVGRGTTAVGTGTTILLCQSLQPMYRVW